MGKKSILKGTIIIAGAGILAKFIGLFFKIPLTGLIGEEGMGIYGFPFSLFLPFDEDVNADINYYISPYYRFYFGKKYAAGFFLEGFGMLNSIDRFQLEFDDFGNVIDSNDNITDFALGIGFGGKWVTNRGFIGELNLGVGRNLFNSDTIDDFVGKLAITLGYRF